ncbi:alkaline phosphatase D family protein [Janthinobacterium fluminis]|uniref:Alkaline phosphatase D family protein n=1 Tax=Janthinobacterium fluminis TaxID=2987524 RepID=A0ABT5K4S0_9BURK|nr:alkaline phosphatase D family protein [Janthinobacterium fluminis]MDC8759854.1 alkaline phosphatase D family protein [Janthinobacterium fluminis]
MKTFFPGLVNDGGAPPRRRFMRQLCSTALLGATGLGATACSSTGAGMADGHDVNFLHGVASGDPLADRVVLWTRVTPRNAQETRDVAVQWQLAGDPEMRQLLASGSVATGPEQDYTVKVDAGGLLPGQVYFYRFSTAGAKSPLGRTRTLPKADVRQVRLAVFSCANYPAGYFNVYADAARQHDLDAALHIGDYIYEYESTGYACADAVALGRVSEPREQLMALGDYRRRYAQYRSDPDLQALHASLPFITVWDDHEIADDTWRDGAAEHKGSRSGPFSLRKAAAIRAYHEWLPIRAPEPARPERIYRSFDFGRLLSLHMLDTRVIGRDQQLMVASYFDAGDSFDADKYRHDVASPRRQMMGREQLDWLERQVAGSRARWQVLGQQVLMARMEYPAPVVMGKISRADYVALKARARSDPASISASERACLAAPTLPCYLDSWDGYQNDREQLFGIMQRQRKNLVVLAGDTHNAWASDLRDGGGRQVGVEFATASVSSPGLECSYPERHPDDVARMMEQLIEPLYYAQTSKRGYMIVTASGDEVRCDWRFVDTVHSRQFSAATERSLRTLAGAGNRKIVECQS